MSAREVPLFDSTDAFRPAAPRAGIALHPLVFGHCKAGKNVVVVFFVVLYIAKWESLSPLAVPFVLNIFANYWVHAV